MYRLPASGSSYAIDFGPKTTFEYVVADDYASISPNKLAFGQLYLGNEATQTITLSNYGKNAFTPVFGTIEAPFSLEVAAAEVAPGASMEIPVKFVANELGEYSQTLTIDCGIAGQFEVLLSGSVAEVPLEVVVCDGDDVSGYLPVYGYYYDMANAKDQMIYPAEMLTELVGKQINQVTFHPTSPLAFYDGLLQMSFKIVEQKGFNDYVPIDSMTVVATAVPVKNDTELTFALDVPFEYTGGNLAIETLNIETGSYASASFYGVNVDGYYPSFYAYGYDHKDVSNFLPKATFGYEKGETPEPEVVRGDVNQDGVVAIADVTTLIDMLLSGAETNPEADCNQDGVVAIADVTCLIDYLLSGEWPAPVAE